MAEDKRIAHSRERICDGFLRCLMKTSLDKVTVSAICKEADVNRSTFYAHYRDPRDVYEFVMKSFFGEVEQALIRFQNGKLSYRAYLLAMLHYGEEHREALLSLYAADRTRFREMLVSVIAEHDLYRLVIKKLQNKYLEAFYLDGSLEVCHRWFSGGCRETPEEMADIIISLVYSENLGIE